MNPVPVSFIESEFYRVLLSIIPTLTSMSISTGVVTLANFRMRAFSVKPSVVVENFSTQGQPSTFGGISMAV